MNIYALRLKSNTSVKSLNPEEYCIGGATRLLHKADGTALLFTSQDRAREYAKSNRLRPCEVRQFEMSLGELLEEIASLDHCVQALLDGNQLIAILTCDRGGYVLPGHFFRYENGSYLALVHHDKWLNNDMDMEYPSCGCGETLGPYIPEALSFPNEKTIPGLYQVLAGNHTTFDGTGCGSTGRIDLERPKEEFLLEVAMSTREGIQKNLYRLTPGGVTFLSEGNDEEEPWRVYEISGLVHINILPPGSSEGVRWIELHRCVREGRKIKRIASTGKARDLPFIQYEMLPEMAREVLEDLRKSSTGESREPVLVY